MGVSLCLFIFELIHVLLIPKAPAFHSAFFPLKCLSLIALLICAFVIPDLNPLFDEWAEFARFFSALYLFIQILLFVAWAYDLNEYLRLRGDQLYAFNDEHGYSQKCCCECIPGNGYHWTLGILSVASLLFAFVALGLFYPLYDRNDENAHCKIHESVTSISIILCGLTGTASVVRGDGSFGVAAMVCLYSTFLLAVLCGDAQRYDGHFGEDTKVRAGEFEWRRRWRNSANRIMTMSMRRRM